MQADSVIGGAGTDFSSRNQARNQVALGGERLVDIRFVGGLRARGWRSIQGERTSHGISGFAHIISGTDILHGVVDVLLGRSVVRALRRGQTWRGSELLYPGNGFVAAQVHHTVVIRLNRQSVLDILLGDHLRSRRRAQYGTNRRQVCRRSGGDDPVLGVHAIVQLKYHYVHGVGGCGVCIGNQRHRERTAGAERGAGVACADWLAR